MDSHVQRSAGPIPHKEGGVISKYDKDGSLDWPYLIAQGQVSYEEARAGGYEPTITQVVTESGAEYRIDDQAKHLRRVSEDYEKRADPEWIPFESHSALQVGARVAILLETLAPYGPDDRGQVVDPEEQPITYRLTTPVVSINTAND